MKDRYSIPATTNWTGRTSGSMAYLHEKVVLQNVMDPSSPIATEKAFALLGYACDEGVRRNLGRPGAAKGPNAIRAQLGKLANHLSDKISLLDLGNFDCLDGDMEATQQALQKQVQTILKNNTFPLLLGGGHDMAYGHYCGLKDYLGEKQSLGIINFDAHFDLRKFEKGTNSGTPFYQIAADCSKHGFPFQYLCLGIRKEANSRELYKTADELGVKYMSRTEFSIQHIEQVEQAIKTFLSKVDTVYVTIDMDGFSSAYAPGVSAASPMGFSPEIVLASLGFIIRSNKLISVDVAEMNPAYDRDDQTAKLAASLLHYIIHEVALL
ncbi:formimidoylglutamase [uncultured Muriicola sp.]|uniref:formimidoylglutamase n=1 Tax=uncultured Muriicola sp. TaxID=1583102 RepID=UPI00262BBE01|nr:formimidoylglutamase [uncultured Muriicola sp.]